MGETWLAACHAACGQMEATANLLHASARRLGELCGMVARGEEVAP